MQNINQVLSNVINEINIQLDSENKLEFIDNERLLSDSSKLDSLALLTFVNILEEEISNDEIDFMDILMTGDKDKVFETIGSLKKFILEK